MRIYFIGICGTAMGNVALSLRARGHDVAGSDRGIYPPMSEVLSEAAIELHDGFDRRFLAGWAPELVVVGNAASRGNDQLEYMLEQRSIPFISMPEAVRRFLLEDRDRMVVAGTHGKTTTSCAAAFLLQTAGFQPGYLIGGVPQDLDSGANLGSLGAPFVLEGDEYDSAIFDKRSKFQHYFPNILLVNNLEFDHGDIFLNDSDYLRSFTHLVRLVPTNGTILINADDPQCLSLAENAYCRIQSVGFGSDADYRIFDFEDDSLGSKFKVRGPRGLICEMSARLNAAFNARNLVMAAVGSALLVGDEARWGEFLEILSEFQGVKRRMELRFESDACCIFEDFGHHPTAIGSSLESLKRRFPEHELWVAFEPRSNTTVTNRFQAELEHAFEKADHLHIAPIFRIERIEQSDRLAPKSLITRSGSQGESWDDWSKFESYLVDQMVASARKRILVFFSNGSFNGLITSVTKALKG
ncbi:MAG: Mur ligase family protein [Verrucomicrobiota bacterium]